MMVAGSTLQPPRARWATPEIFAPTGRRTVTFPRQGTEIWMSYRPLADVPDRLRAVIDALPETQWPVMTLRFVFGLSALEITDVVGSAPGAVRQLQHRAHKRLAGGMSRDRA